MKKLRAAVIGLGFIGVQHIDALRRVPSAEVAAVCTRNEEKLHSICEQYHIEKGCTDWHDIIADPDIDVIHNCTPHRLHDEINRAAILAGKHVYSEKPLSLTTAGAREMVLLAREHHVAAGLNHQYRMNAAVQEMKARLQKGLSGRTLMVTGCYLQESGSRPTDWTPKMDNTGIARVLNDIGIHWADTVCAVLGQPIVEVFADTFIHYPVRTDEQGVQHPMNTEDSAMVLVRFADGTPGQLFTSKAANGHKNDLQVCIWGEEYSMEWAQEIPDRLTLGRKGTGFETVYMNPKTCQPETVPYITAPMGHMMGWPDALRNAMNAYYQSISDGTFMNENQPYSTFSDGFMGAAFVEACVRSAKERRWIEVERL